MWIECALSLAGNDGNRAIQLAILRRGDGHPAGFARWPDLLFGLPREAGLRRGHDRCGLLFVWIARRFSPHLRPLGFVSLALARSRVARHEASPSDLLPLRF